MELIDHGRDVLAFRRDDVLVLLNCGRRPVAVPEGEVILASAPLSKGRLPADATLWLRLPSR